MNTGEQLLRAPATKFYRFIKRLNAALRGGVCVSTTRGSTVEARGAELLHITAKTRKALAEEGDVQAAGTF